ncbi:uncharacterized protein LY89DRAFT_735694 [Mollisia scopiformis]|uniref:DUF6536 domain-containing protein n=1 Tax=Mollisia scopiformis TaxID=149040 RepID=A0A194X338_MOLSC|nr:uncharacterized protein LY89DRAFT_735694 [Mollisia scopiformis]KUJ14615.1 hypothetical protein LY89DRAFT_735694 [Mollisia scopiformis]
MTPSDAINVSQQYQKTRFPQDYVLSNGGAAKYRVHHEQCSSAVTSHSDQRLSKACTTKNVVSVSQRYRETRFPRDYTVLNSEASQYVVHEVNEEEQSTEDRVNTRTSSTTPTLLTIYVTSSQPTQNLAATTFIRMEGRAALAHGAQLGGFALFYQGKCSTSSTLTLWCHVLINLLSSALLSASNYCMQILSSPTRSEINKAHSQKRWLDIGLQSMKNLRNISPKRRKMWWLLVLSSAPLHLMYNSTIFSMSAAHEYFVALVVPGFLSPQLALDATANLSLSSDILTLHDRLQNTSLTFEQLDTLDCFKDYSQRYVTDRSHLIVVLQENWQTMDTFL